MEKYIPLGISDNAKIALVINSDLNPRLIEILKNEGLQIEIDPEKREEVDIAFIISRFPSKNLVYPTIKELDWKFIHPKEDFKTEAQRELEKLDWKMLKELETLLPVDNQLRQLRDTYRSNTDIEIMNYKRNK